MEETKGITNILEIMDASELVLVTGKVVMKDGINAADIAPVIEMAKQYDVFMKAVDGAGEAIQEGKDLSADELMAIGARAVAMFRKVQAA